MAFSPLPSGYQPFYINGVNLLEDCNTIAYSEPCIELGERKDIVSNDWKEENGVDEYIPSTPHYKQSTWKVSFITKAYGTKTQTLSARQNAVKNLWAYVVDVQNLLNEHSSQSVTSPLTLKDNYTMLECEGARAGVPQFDDDKKPKFGVDTGGTYAMIRYSVTFYINNPTQLLPTTE